MQHQGVWVGMAVVELGQVEVGLMLSKVLVGGAYGKGGGGCLERGQQLSV